jgi:hypothetical protein
MSWSISIKVVGSLLPSNDPSSSPLRDFTIIMEPSDTIALLHAKIEEITGLVTVQQRLIFKGRLISASSTDDAPLCTPISQVAGLENGHTVHLVPRPVPRLNDNNDSLSPNRDTVATTAEIADHDPSDTGIGIGIGSILSDIGGAGLLSALFNADSSQDQGNDGATPAAAGMDPLEALFSSLPRTETRERSSRNRRRRPNSHRRLETDERHSEPCPLEPIRQGMLTLHTMIGDRDRDININIRQREPSSPLDVNRKWFKGQWLDARDTVNQWLEATVVQVLTPDDLLMRVPKEKSSTTDDAHNDDTLGSMNANPAMDPAIGANDMEGRIRLLLEGSKDESDETLADLNDNQDLIGLIERKNNDHVQLLLIHYNGWPHRWDEWIRSDSERIRPFRTRSKHLSRRSHVCPSPESTFHSAPATHVKSGDDAIDRVAILPELYRALGDVQNIFARAIRVDDRPLEESKLDRVRPLSHKEQSNLSVTMQELDVSVIDEVMVIVQGDNEGGKDMDPSDIVIADLDLETQWKLKKLLEPVFDIGDDQSLPWKSRKNRRDFGNDSDSLEERNWKSGDERGSEVPDFDKKNLEALGPLLDRLGRILIDVAPHVSTIANSLSEPLQPEILSNEESEEPSMNTIDPISLRPSWAQATTPSLFESDSNESATNNNDSAATNPDYVDFVHGFVNQRNESPSARRSSSRRNQGGDSGLGSSLLSAYLSSTLGGGSTENGSGPRVVRVGANGGDGGGVGFHIHAIVTGPPGGSRGMPNFLQNAGPAFTQHANTNNVTTNIEPSNPLADEEDTEVLDDLYSENPQEEGPHSNMRHTDEVEIEIEDDQRDDDIASTSSSISGLPALLEPNDDSNSSDDNSDDDSISGMPALRERNDDSSSSDDNSDDDSISEMPALLEPDDEIISSDDNSDDDSISGMPALLEPNDDISSADDNSNDDSSVIVPSHYSANGDYSDDSSDSATPSTISNPYDEYRSSDGVHECVEEDSTSKNVVENPEVVPLVMKKRDDGNMEVCLSPKNENGGDNTEGDTKNASDILKTSTSEQHVIEASVNNSLEALDKCDHDVLNDEASKETLANESQPSNGIRQLSDPAGSGTVSSTNGAIESIRPSLFSRLFRRH